MPEALVLGVGAVATLTSAAILLGTFAYVALYALLYRITPVVLLWTGYHLLTDPVDFCAARGPWCDLAGGAPAYDAVGALLVVTAVGALATARTRCWMTMALYAAAWAAALGALSTNAPAAVAPHVTQIARAAAALALCHASAPVLSKKIIGGRKPQYLGYI